MDVDPRAAVGALIRHAVNAVGAAAVTLGLATPEGAEQFASGTTEILTGIVFILLAYAWSLYEKNRD